jgi:hypothetical protein
MFASKVWPISMDRGLTLTNILAYYKGKLKMAVKILIVQAPQCSSLHF